MILAFDTYYFNNKATTVCISFTDWSNEENYTVYSAITENIAEYKPGEFYKRELPCILHLLNEINIGDVHTIIIDGYVHLDDNENPGLGAHLHKHLQRKIAVIGVAKTNFATVDKKKRQLVRGNSIKPLYITSIGIDVDEAAKLIENMSGPNRIPTLLKTLDSLTKEKKQN